MANSPSPPQRRIRQRSDAVRSNGKVLDAAKDIFETIGVDAPVRDIADRAEVGVGTVYRHFPKRSDLIIAVLEREVDEVIDAGPNNESSDPVEAIKTWLHNYMAFVSTKRGLASALHSGETAYEGLPAYFIDRLQPHLQALLASAVAANRIREDVSARDLLRAVAHLGVPAGGEGLDFSQRMIGLLLDGLTVSH